MANKNDVHLVDGPMRVIIGIAIAAVVFMLGYALGAVGSPLSAGADSASSSVSNTDNGAIDNSTADTSATSATDAFAY